MTQESTYRPGGGAAVDHELVGLVRGRVVAELSRERRDRLDQGLPGLSRDDERRMGRSMISAVLLAHRDGQLDAGIPLPDTDADQAVLDAVHAALFGLGALQPLIDDMSLSEINVTGCDRVWVTRDDGSKQLAAPVAGSDGELVEWVRTMATYSGLSSRPWDTANPYVELRLPDGSRLTALMGVTERPVVSIRLNRRPQVTLDDLRALGDYDVELQRFLEALVDASMNVLISGETGSAKTTLLRAMTRRIPAADRLVTVEHFRELGLDEQPEHHPDVIAIEERPDNAEGAGGWTMRSSVKAARRLNPDRLIVGEVVGGEIVALLESMTQGNDGGLTTIHSRTARQVPERVATYGMAEGVSVEHSMLMVASGVDFVVHMARRRTPDGRLARWVESVVEVGSYDGTQVITSEVWATPPGATYAVPAAQLSQRRADRLGEHGWVPGATADTRGGHGFGPAGGPNRVADRNGLAAVAAGNGVAAVNGFGGRPGAGGVL